MGKERRRGEREVVDSEGALSMDQSKMQSERRAATDRLLARLKALDRKAVQTPRAYAQRYVREQESLILGLLNAGVGTGEILTELALAFPSIPGADFRHAIAQLRDRRRKQIGATAAAPTVHSVSMSVSEAPSRALPQTTDSVPLAPDRQPDESEQDYGLRKELEGAPDQSRSFIGEQ